MPYPKEKKFICQECGKEFHRYVSKKTYNRFCSRICFGKAEVGEKHSNWQGGITKNKEYRKLYYQQYYCKNRKHKIEQVKKYALFNKDKIRARMRIWEKGNYHSRRCPIRLIKSVVQMVYEDNIKKYGTLTCVLCNKPIKFGQDSLEHLLPVTRGGTNEYSNLAIAHRSCNSAKNNKTLKEWNDYKKEKELIDDHRRKEKAI